MRRYGYQKVYMILPYMARYYFYLIRCTHHPYQFSGSISYFP